MPGEWEADVLKVLKVDVLGIDALEADALEPDWSRNDSPNGQFVAIVVIFHLRFSLVTFEWYYLPRSH